MEQVAVCDERTIKAIAQALSRCAIGHPVSFGFEGGLTRHTEGDKVIEVPNGTVTFRLFVNGGAVDHQAAPPPQTPPTVTP